MFDVLCEVWDCDPDPHSENEVSFGCGSNGDTCYIFS